MDIQQTFQNKTFSRYGVEYSVVGKYINSRTKIKIKHNICGHTWTPIPSNFLSKCKPTLCPTCTNPKRRKTNEEFIMEVYKLVGDEYTPLENYKNSYTKLKMIHNTCNHVWFIRPDSFVNKRVRCPKCNKGGGFKKKITDEVFKARVFENVGSEYTILGSFQNTKTKIKTKHNVCGFIWDANPDELLKKSGSRCPKCANRLRKTNQWFLSEVFKQVGSEYTVIGKYKNAKTKIKMKHEYCGHEWEVRPGKFVGSEKTRCPNCFKSNKKDHKQFIQEVYNAVGDEYSVISNYHSNKKHVKMLHNKCGHEWRVTPGNFLHVNNPTRCPKCNESKGEKRISDFLMEFGISFVPQYRIDECRNIKPLPFDFAVFQGNKLMFLIEFDGEYHYKAIKGRGGIKNLKNVQKRDQIKTEYCQNNNINLVRIPYYQINRLEEILTTELIKHKLIPPINIRIAA
ncbi:hypothetical protein NDS46_31410 (plasmid) [Paenibacillus thiaminolyticus]|uniref:hypothetical protein n=1 Tax=Paenibacillus thiaminolyticus TaxID=49283 RepID=UPI00232ADEE6|nr:hypothetical protein [Paenibacillus thiaminolyticus]WCF11467.1 hypothetical protein NDS46_31410 [Paenibacillus thiaminolyticus]